MTTVPKLFPLVHKLWAERVSDEEVEEYQQEASGNIINACDPDDISPDMVHVGAFELYAMTTELLMLRKATKQRYSLRKRNAITKEE